MGLTGAPAAAPFPASDTKPTSEYSGPFGRVFIDDATGSEYMLVDCQEAFTVGEVVVIDVAGLATAITDTSRGRVGIVVATVSGSDTAAYVQISGPTSSSVLCSSGVTTTGQVIANVSTETGSFGELSTTAGNVVYGAWAVTAPSTATSPVGPGALGAFVLNRPFVMGKDNAHTMTS